jgi:hypothetical protein
VVVVVGGGGCGGWPAVDCGEVFFIVCIFSLSCAKNYTAKKCAFFFYVLCILFAVR